MAKLRVWFQILLYVALGWSASMRLPSYPLAVKTPYLSVWMPGHLSNDFPNATPQFWRNQELTWILLARINGTTYCLMGCTGGRPGTVQAKQKSLSFSSTHTYVSLEAGNTEVTLDFFSPVDPVDHVRQSLPYSYLTVSERSNDTKTKLDGVLVAIDASWLSTRGRPIAKRHTFNGSNILTLNGERELLFSEHRNMALWGDVVLATKSDSDLSATSCQVGSPQSVFGSFIQNGELSDVISTMEYDNLAACSQAVPSQYGNSTVTFAIGLHQDREIQYFDGNSTKSQAGYFRSQIANVSEAVKHFFDDFEEASNQSRRLDQHIRTMGEVTSSNYSDVLEFAVRQSFAGMQVTIPYDTLDTSDPYAFIKEIATDGNVNTLADLIPKALPIFHVLNPEYTRMFLEPVLRYSLKAWPLNHAVHDIGKSYPNATGETPCIEEFLPLDSTSVLLWMLYLYQNTTGNRQMTEDYAPILKTYADYCLNYGFLPVLQRSSVDAIGSAPNQTALSVSAAIALNAYGKMTGQSNYTKWGLEFAEKILDIGRDSHGTHFLSHYNDEDDSWVQMYPLGFDAWLGLETFPRWVHEMQSNWYSQHVYQYGVQFRNNIRYTLMEWQMWIASTSPNELRDQLVNGVHRFLSRDTGPGESVPGPTQWVIAPGENEGRWTFFSKAKSNVGSVYMIAAVQGGFNNSFAPVRNPMVSPLGHHVLETGSFTVQDPNTLALEIPPRDSIATRSGQFDIPYDVPVGASKPVGPQFLGLSFDTVSLPQYMGNLSSPNDKTRELIRNLIGQSDAKLTIRVGSPDGDYSIFDPIQATALERVDVSGISTLSLGPSFFDSIRALDNLKRLMWIYQVPFAPRDKLNAIQCVQRAMDAVPDEQLFALEIGHKANFYAGASRPETYNCRMFAAEMFEFKVALRRNIDRVGGQFQALGLSSSRISDSWSMEECFTVGINSQGDLRSVSLHYSQSDTNRELLSSKLPRHSAIQREFKEITPQANYVRDIFPCHPIIISEASLVSTTANDYDAVDSSLNHQSSLAIGLWNLDFLLYAMSQNVSRVLMHQSCTSLSSAWTPDSCRSHSTARNESTKVNGPYYALTFAASFVRGAQNFRVIPIQESEDSVVYAGYEAGKLSKIAVVNYPPPEGAERMSGFEQDTFDFQVPPEIKHVNFKARMSSSSFDCEDSGFTERIWNSENLVQVLFERESPAYFSVREGVLSITMHRAEAILLEVVD